MHIWINLSKRIVLFTYVNPDHSAHIGQHKDSSIFKTFYALNLEFTAIVWFFPIFSMNCHFFLVRASVCLLNDFRKQIILKATATGLLVLILSWQASDTSCLFCNVCFFFELLFFELDSFFRIAAVDFQVFSVNIRSIFHQITPKQHTQFGRIKCKNVGRKFSENAYPDFVFYIS